MATTRQEEAVATDGDLSALREKLGAKFRTDQALKDALESEGIAPFFQELLQDFLIDHPGIDDPDFNETMKHHAMVNTMWVHQYQAENVDKSQFTALDHAVRFMVGIISYDIGNAGRFGWG
ncbi:Uu.00g078530.m01.CDS01 [Anthostomella pinea]|uniref:Uu.00g078530.m01.CDS01 n=1 Tax=Anthostomella pinea TaxID=933095 RepID=A0AAI8VL94_9PEZI|nr:Uu.00g078530.m01.CDS01 [Anthostomella pinea]